MIKLINRINRVTEQELSAQYGSDKGRRLVVSLVPIPSKDGRIQDLIELRPHGTRRAELIPIEAVYAFAIRSRVNKEWMEKLREKKLKKTAARERAAIARADRKITAAAKGGAS
jgi:hypothetical protein